MCHSNFELELGPKLNFIIGHNGSGKSAILTAISVCLGAKATETNRGSNLRDLIKEGSNSCTISVVLKNTGPGAYEPGKYGKEIVVERQLRRENSGSIPYILKSETGKRISTKKADLDAILDCFNIAVNNPMAFLSQDAARSFLTASSDEQKYKYFMRGTLMEEILKNFYQTRDQVDSINRKLVDFKKTIIELREDSRKAHDLHKKLKTSNHLRTEQRRIHGKFYWVQVQSAKADLENWKAAASELESKIAAFDSQIADAKEKAAEKAQERDNLVLKAGLLKQRVQESTIILSEKRENARSIIKKNKELDEEFENVEADIKKKEKDLQITLEEIEKEKLKLSEKQGGSRELLEQQLREFEEKETELNHTINSLNENLINIETEHKVAYEDLEREISAKKEEIGQLSALINNLKTKKVDELAPYPDTVRKSVSEINRRASEFHNRPFGPLGAYINIKQEYSGWAALIDSHLGAALTTFFAYDNHDRVILEGILRKNRCNAQVFSRRLEKFDFSSGCPDKKYLTILDTLEFKRPEIKLILIDLSHIESIILEEERTEGERIVQSGATNVQQAITRDKKGSGGYRASVNRNGGFRSDPLYIHHNTLPKVTVKNPSNDVGGYTADLNSLRKLSEELIHNRKGLGEKLNREKSEINNEIRSLKKSLNNVKTSKYHVTQKLEDDADNGRLQDLEENKTEIEKQIEFNERALGDLKEDLDKVLAKKGDVANDFAEYKERHEKAVMMEEAIIEKVTQLEDAIEARNQGTLHFEKEKLYALQNQKEQTESIQKAEDHVQNCIQHATSICSEEEASTIRINDQAALQQKVQRITKELERAHEALGKSPEEVVNEDIIAREKYIEAKRKFDEAVETKDLLQRSLDDRLKVFRENRDTTCIEADVDFTNSLQHRGFTGKLVFDFNKSKLSMLVRTTNDIKPRHVDSLSGGEKSFSQISLLLATWKPMRSRIKGLDEFDVFMDQVNRKMGMRLMLSKLSKELKSQTIFITPQDIGQIAELDERTVKIHRIKDPRGIQRS
ncbi:hypothetical protein WICMUC_001054 [Wickerhamomyces mucosus]|uniref:Rad50/SbcC-type AAA domain-containing protein n=1 Tax=Wickerhamomyces mucosus TaxID=1378264 RepID=A0A9P8PW25_9ASCO|nr:hypothetical protein WICMUC_001054 [Wickerhamomyces mucosus]